MEFGDSFDTILPSYLVREDKARLKDALKQFSPDRNGNGIDYNNFYKNYGHLYFMQSDLIKEIRMSVWNDDISNYEKGYSDAIIISNTCDISNDNKHELNKKQCLFAPVIDFNEYISDLTNSGYPKEKLQQFISSVKTQLITNLFYLPFFHKENKEYVVLLDNVFWFPTEELNSYIENIKENRITSLGQFGYYLFILKLSYHICRLPEQCDREV